MKEIVCSLCGKKIGIKAFVLHLKHKHHEYSPNHGQKYYDTFIDNSDHKCPLCDKEKHFHSITYGYDTTCSVEHANALRGIKIKESGSRKGIGKGIKKGPKTEEQKKRQSIRMLKFYQTERGKESKLQASERQKGDKNTCHKITKETRQRINKIVSEKIKIRILNGQFTPKVTNSWANSRVKIKINGYDKEYRSSWDAAFQILNPTFVYEKIRIPYINERNEEHVYIVDFVDEANKILYEIKPSRCVDNIRNILKTKYAIEWCEKNGYKYKIISDEYFKTNVKIINFSDYDSRIYNGMKQFL